ncbi:MAG: hypothetical protein WCX97_05180 [Candidatus Magasanikbacteria bacterium]
MANKISEYFEELKKKTQLYPDDDGYDLFAGTQLGTTTDSLLNRFQEFLATTSTEDIDTWFAEAHKPIDDFTNQADKTIHGSLDSWLLNVNQATLRIVRIRRLLIFAQTEYRSTDFSLKFLTDLIYELHGDDPELFC